MGLDKHPRPESPYTLEEMELSRRNFLAAHNTPKVQAFMGKLIQLGLIAWVCVAQYLMYRKDRMIESFRPMVIRVNDVGRAEAVRIDNTYVPEEPEIRNQLTALTVRMFERNGFTLPTNMELNSLYISGAAWQEWWKEAWGDLPLVAKMEGLKRVRILQCRIESVGAAKSDGGTIASVRFATDKLTANGSVVPNSAVGFEVSYRFKVGAYPDIQDGIIRDRWVIRNPLGIRVGNYQVIRYTGPDVDAPDGIRQPDDIRLPGATSAYAVDKEGHMDINNMKPIESRN